MEKSRLMNQGKGERGYHVFYQMCKGMNNEERQRYMLKSAKDYKCLIVGNVVDDPGIDDVKDYQCMRAAMSTVGMSAEEQHSIFSVCAAILHLQNLEFVENPETQSTSVSDSTKEELISAATLLSVDKDALTRVMTTKTIEVMKNLITSSLNVDSAKDARDGLSKSLYSSLFNWIVQKINSTTCAKSFDHFIGLLDIFGFEQFEKNSFEQLCINFANESLQGHYNNHTFTLDLHECEKEGIDISSISFNDNQKCIDLIQGGKTAANKWGILVVLDEACNFPKATDKTFLEVCNKYFIKEPNARDMYPDYSLDPRKQTSFKIKHYAAEVEYNVEGWLEKNKDLLKEDCIECIDASKDQFVRQLFAEKVEDLKAERDKDSGKGKKKKLTVGGQFKQQLSDLLATINKTTPYWIRTIKPHKAKKPGMFSGPEVMSQLRSSGVLETIRIRKTGYPIRIKHQNFFRTFRILLKDFVPQKPIMEISDKEAKEYCAQLLKVSNFDKNNAQIGKSKVFLKSEAFKVMEKRKTELLSSSIVLVQNVVQKIVSEQKFDILREKLLIQKMRIEYDKVSELVEKFREEKERKRKEEEEKKRREEEERLRKEEIERKERERLEKIREMKRKIEEEKQRKLDEIRLQKEEEERREKERVLEIQRMEEEKIKKQKEEEDRLRFEQERAEKEKLEAARREMEERRQEMIRQEEQRLLNLKKEREEARLAQLRAIRLEKEKREAKIMEEKKKAEAIAQKEREERDFKLKEKAKVEKTQRIKRESEKKQWESLEADRIRSKLEIEKEKKLEKLQKEYERKSKLILKEKLIQQKQEQSAMNLVTKLTKHEEIKSQLELYKTQKMQEKLERRKKVQENIEKKRLIEMVVTQQKKERIIEEEQREIERREMEGEFKRQMKEKELIEQMKLERQLMEIKKQEFDLEQRKRTMQAQAEKKFEIHNEAKKKELSDKHKKLISEYHQSSREVALANSSNFSPLNDSKLLEEVESIMNNSSSNISSTSMTPRKVMSVRQKIREPVVEVSPEQESDGFDGFLTSRSQSSIASMSSPRFVVPQKGMFSKPLVGSSMGFGPKFGNSSNSKSNNNSNQNLTKGVKLPEKGSFSFL